MKSSVQGPPERAAQRLCPIHAPQAPAKAAPICPECLQPFHRKHPGQLFCTTTHRDDWNNRAAVRGRVLAPLSMVAHLTRSGTRIDPEIGKRAAAEMRALITRWRDEDRKAGRMDHPAYLRLRYRVGFDPLG